MAFSTRALKCFATIGNGPYSWLKCIDQRGKVHTIYRFNLTDEQLSKLKEEYHFLRTEHRENKEFADKMIPIAPQMLAILKAVVKK